MNQLKQNLYLSKLEKLAAKLDESELKTRHIKLLLDYYDDPPQRYEKELDIWWAKEVKPENDKTNGVK